jgi:hypothetical protein
MANEPQSNYIPGLGLVRSYANVTPEQTYVRPDPNTPSFQKSLIGNAIETELEKQVRKAHDTDTTKKKTEKLAEGDSDVIDETSDQVEKLTDRVIDEAQPTSKKARKLRPGDAPESTAKSATDEDVITEVEKAKRKTPSGTVDVPEEIDPADAEGDDEPVEVPEEMDPAEKSEIVVLQRDDRVLHVKSQTQGVVRRAVMIDGELHYNVALDNGAVRQVPAAGVMPVEE